MKVLDDFKKDEEDPEVDKKKSPIYVLDEIDGDSDVKYDLIIDTREKSVFLQKLIVVLQYNKFTYRIKKLSGGDYFVNRGLGSLMEMKSIGDLLNTSFHDSRKDGNALSSELENMTDDTIFSCGGKNIEKCVVCRNMNTLKIDMELCEEEEKKVVKGKEKIVKKMTENYVVKYKDDNGSERRSSMHPNAFIGILKRIQFKTKFYGMFGDDHTISWIISQIRSQIKIEKEIQNGMFGLKSMKTVRRDAEDDEIQRSIITGFRDVGDVGSDKLLEYFGSVNNVFSNCLPENKDVFTKLLRNSKASDDMIRIANLKYEKKDIKKI